MQGIPPQIKATLKNKLLLLSSLIRVPTKEHSATPIILWPAQRDYIENHTNADLILKSRQLGITTIVTADYFLDTILTPYTTTFSIAQDDATAMSVVMGKYKSYYETMPEAINIGGVLIKVKPDVGNYSDHLISFEELDGRPLKSRIRVGTAGSVKIARGETVHRFHGTEVALWPEGTAEFIMGALEGAMPATGRRVLESTAFGASGFWFELWERAKRGEAGYKTHLYPWWKDDNARLAPNSKDAIQLGLSNLEPTEQEAQLMLKHGLDIDQIRFYRAKQIRIGKIYPQELASDDITCFLVSGSHVFDLDSITWYAEHIREPLTDKDGVLKWLPPLAGETYIVGADASEGTSEDSDYCAAVVLNVKTLEHCATLHGRFAPREFAHRLAGLAKTYNDAMIAAERIAVGGTIVTLLEDYGYSNLYVGDDGKTGWYPSRVTKPLMIDELKTLVDNRLLKSYDRLLISELRNYSELKRGDTLVMRASTGHDDMVAAAGIAAFCRFAAEDGGATAKIIRYGW